MSEIDQQFIEYVVKSLVGKPDAVQIERRIDEKGVLLELTVDPEDLGRVIGKRGATAQSLRTLLRALGTKNDARYNLKIIGNGPLDHNSGTDTGTVTDNTVADAPVANGANDIPQSSVDNDTSVDGEPPEMAAAPGDDKSEYKSDNQADNATSDRLRKARAELADLDDLDV